MGILLHKSKQELSINQNQKQIKFLALYEPIAESLERFCLNLARNRNDAKDLIGDTVCASYEGFESVKDSKAFLSFVFTIAHRIYYSTLYKSKRNVYNDPIEFSNLISHNLSPEQEFDIKVLYQAMEELDEKQREALILSEIFGFKHKEVAEVQSTTVANIKIRIFRAKKKLKKILVNDITINNHIIKQGIPR